jgi:hypothetical protein
VTEAVVGARDELDGLAGEESDGVDERDIFFNGFRMTGSPSLEVAAVGVSSGRSTMTLLMRSRSPL